MSKQYYYFAKELPPVLSGEEQEILIKDIKNPEAVEKLIKGNLRLVMKIAIKYQSTGIDIKDLFSIGTIGLMKSINRFDPEKKIKLVTFSARCINNEILMFLRGNKKIKHECSLTDSLHTDNDGNELKIEDVVPDYKIRAEEKYENAEIVSNTMTLALSSMKKRDKIVFLLNLCNFDQKIIAEKCNMSQSYISRILNKARNECRSYSKMAIDKNKKYKYVFLCAEEHFDFGVLIDKCPDLEKEFPNLRDSLCGDELSWYKELDARKEKDYFIIKLPKAEETFLFIARFMKMFEEE